MASLSAEQLPAPVLTEAHEVSGLATYLHRLLRYDRRAAVRLVADGLVLGCFGGPPFHVVSVRTARLAAPTALDVTVSAGQLLDALAEDPGPAEDSAGGGSGLALPPPVAAPAWSGVLPPRRGWRMLVKLAPGEAFRLAEDAVAEFRARAEAMPASADRAALDEIAEDVWSRPMAGGVPARAVHAALALGFVAPDTPASVHAAGPWLQLRTPYGVVAARHPDAPALRFA